MSVHVLRMVLNKNLWRSIQAKTYYKFLKLNELKLIHRELHCSYEYSS